MKIYFGLELEDTVLPLPEDSTCGISYFGPQGMLQYLSVLFGIPKPPLGAEYLRLEQYRQSLKNHLQINEEKEPFYRTSFLADQFATANEILQRRDELLLSGWNFNIGNEVPPRLQTIAEIEAIFQQIIHQQRHFAGFADRWMQVLEKISVKENTIREIHHCEPLHLLPTHIFKLIEKLREHGTKVRPVAFPKPTGNDDLHKFQNYLATPPTTKSKQKLSADGSLLILKGTNEASIARFVAGLMRKNDNFRPECLITAECRALDNAFIQEGLPSLGIKSASLARPSMQVLKLATSFLWKPIDPFKLLEFVSLQIKPLDNELANRIAEHIVQRPGIKGDGWYAMINQFFNHIEADDQIDLATKKEIKFQYQFWFERKQYDLHQSAPKSEVYAIFEYLESWALQVFQNEGETNQALLKLSVQARKTKDLLEALPEISLKPIEIERIVKTIYEPAAIQFMPSQKGFLPFVSQPGAIIGPIPKLLWWNFTANDVEYFFSSWYQEELRFLQGLEVELVSPKQQNEWQNWRKKQPIFAVSHQLVLTIPEKIRGSQVHPHSLMGNLAAIFENLEDITIDLEKEATMSLLDQYFNRPRKRSVPYRKLAKPTPFLRTPPINLPVDLERQETVTSLEALLYYPYQWFFRHYLKIKKSSIVSIADQRTLYGNLAHRFIEQLLLEDSLSWEKMQLESWIEQKAETLLEKEGAVLLMYGREAERINFINTIKFSAWRLLNMLRNNNWIVEKVEHPLEGLCEGIPIRGRADLVLNRSDEKAILDLKWSGAGYRSQLIKNKEDLQLIIYAHLLAAGNQWPHSAYYILQNGKMIARNKAAFDEVIPIVADEDTTIINTNILERIGTTYQWRQSQLQKGAVEVRCELTEKELESYYEGSALDLLEMKKGDATFDDYRVLINLVE